MLNEKVTFLLKISLSYRGMSRQPAMGVTGHDFDDPSIELCVEFLSWLGVSPRMLNCSIQVICPAQAYLTRIVGLLSLVTSKSCDRLLTVVLVLLSISLSALCSRVKQYGSALE